MRGWRLLVVPWVLAALATAAALGIERWSAALQDGERRLPPLVERATLALSLVAAVLIVWALVRVVRRVRFRMRSDVSRIAAMTALIIMHLVAVPGVFVGALVADPEFPFGDAYRGSIQSPHGATVYLFQGGIFCSYDVYERAPGALLLKRRFTIAPDSCVDGARLGWDKQLDAPVVLGPDGKRIENGTVLERAFDWGPH